MKQLQLFTAIAFIIIMSGCEALSNMAGTPKPTSVTITSVKLLNFPAKKSDGLPWDPLGGRPDIYFTIGKDGFKRILHENVANGTQLTWNLQRPFNSANLNQDIIFYFYDEDEQGLNISKDDFMGLALFRPSTYLMSSSIPPRTITLEGSGVSIELSLSWK